MTSKKKIFLLVLVSLIVGLTFGYTIGYANGVLTVVNQGMKFLNMSAEDVGFDKENFKNYAVQYINRELNKYGTNYTN